MADVALQAPAGTGTIAVRPRLVDQAIADLHERLTAAFERVLLSTTAEQYRQKARQQRPQSLPSRRELLVSTG